MEDEADAYSALGNPIQRDMLAYIGDHQPVSFSSLLKYTGIETSKLSFHLDKMRGLLSHDEKKRYGLNDMGKKALEAMIHMGGAGLPQQKTRPEAMIMDDMRTIGLLLFFLGTSSLMGYWFYAVLGAGLPKPISLGIAAIMLGLAFILASLARERLKEEGKDDYRKY